MLLRRVETQLSRKQSSRRPKTAAIICKATPANTDHLSHHHKEAWLAEAEDKCQKSNDARSKLKTVVEVATTHSLTTSYPVKHEYTMTDHWLVGTYLLVPVWELVK